MRERERRNDRKKNQLPPLKRSCSPKTTGRYPNTKLDWEFRAGAERLKSSAENTRNTVFHLQEISMARTGKF
jgi:hypothetical protein